MAADRRVDAARPVHLVGVDDLGVEFFAHAVQALKFIVSIRATVVQDARQCVRIVRRKLGINTVAGGQCLSRTGQVGHVGMHLSCEDRITLQPLLLSALDLGIPVRTLYQAQRNAAAAISGQRFQERQGGTGTALIGLQCKTKTVPAL